MNHITGIRQEKYVNPEELEQYIGREIYLKGSIYKIRRMKGFAFVLVRTARKIIQCIYVPEEAGFLLSVIREECCCKIYARVEAEERSRTGYELHLLDVHVLSEPKEISPVVINGKQMNTSIENLLNYRPVTLRNEKERAIFRSEYGIWLSLSHYAE